MPPPDDGFAHNDDRGAIHCHLCDYVSDPMWSFEMAEAEAVRHLRDKHGKTILFAIEDETGKVKQTPQ